MLGFRVKFKHEGIKSSVTETLSSLRKHPDEIMASGSLRRPEIYREPVLAGF